MTEESWHSARLIPTSGINGAEEQERRATSALLAVLSSVKEFGRTVLGPLGAPAGTVETFIEVPFDHDGARLYPDGLVRVKRGQRTWTSLVEVKTGKNELNTVQLEAYLDIVKDHGFDALLTISNQMVGQSGGHPTAVDKRKLRKAELHHLSWTQVVTEAVMQKVHRGVSDPDQAWILGELIRYLEHPRSGAMEFEDMGVHWVSVREAVSAGTLRRTDAGAADVVARWEQLVRYAGLRLGRQLGIEVQPVQRRKDAQDAASRSQAAVAALVDEGRLQGSLRIPNTVGPLQVVADLRAGRVDCSVELDAPKTGRPITRVSWLVRQLPEGPDALRIDAAAARSRSAGTSALLAAVRQEPGVLIEDPKKEVKSFRLTRSAGLGGRRSGGRGAFVPSVSDAIDAFYSEVMQNLKPWRDKPPTLRVEDPPLEEVAAPLRSTSLSSQDGADADGPAADRSEVDEGRAGFRG